MSEAAYRETHTKGEKPVYREAYDYDPDRKAQGHYLNQMKAYANTEITNDDAATMRGASFRAFDFVCRNITRTQGIRKDKVYPALRLLGYNRCYNAKKSNYGEDVFSEISRLVQDAESQLNYANMMRMEATRGFIDVTMTRKNYRVEASTQKIALDTSDEAGIRTSELNLYHAMHGLKVLTEEEPDFIILRENEIIVGVLEVLTRAEQGLIAYKEDLTKLR